MKVKHRRSRSVSEEPSHLNKLSTWNLASMFEAFLGSFESETLDSWSSSEHRETPHSWSSSEESETLDSGSSSEESARTSIPSSVMVKNKIRDNDKIHPRDRKRVDDNSRAKQMWSHWREKSDLSSRHSTVGTNEDSDSTIMKLAAFDDNLKTETCIQMNDSGDVSTLSSSEIDSIISFAKRRTWSSLSRFDNSLKHFKVRGNHSGKFAQWSENAQTSSIKERVGPINVKNRKCSSEFIAKSAYITSSSNKSSKTSQVPRQSGGVRNNHKDRDVLATVTEDSKGGESTDLFNQNVNKIRINMPRAIKQSLSEKVRESDTKSRSQSLSPSFSRNYSSKETKVSDRELKMNHQSENWGRGPTMMKQSKPDSFHGGVGQLRKNLSSKSYLGGSSDLPKKSVRSTRNLPNNRPTRLRNKGNSSSYSWLEKRFKVRTKSSMTSKSAQDRAKKNIHRPKRTESGIVHRKAVKNLTKVSPKSKSSRSHDHCENDMIGPTARAKGIKKFPLLHPKRVHFDGTVTNVPVETRRSEPFQVLHKVDKTCNERTSKAKCGRSVRRRDSGRHLAIEKVLPNAKQCIFLSRKPRRVEFHKRVSTRSSKKTAKHPQHKKLGAAPKRSEKKPRKSHTRRNRRFTHQSIQNHP